MPVLPRLRDRPDPVGALAGFGAGVCGVLGGVAGLILGLLAHPPTALFAMFELGLPAAAAGGVIGLLAGLGVKTFRHSREP